MSLLPADQLWSPLFTEARATAGYGLPLISIPVPSSAKPGFEMARLYWLI